jgi:hypothetical protein
MDGLPAFGGPFDGQLIHSNWPIVALEDPAPSDPRGLKVLEYQRHEIAYDGRSFFYYVRKGDPIPPFTGVLRALGLSTAGAS